MLKHTIMDPEGVLVVEPQAALSVEDFRGLTAEVDGYLDKHAVLHGVLVHAQSFPGWESFAGFTAHLKFVREHHKQIERIALVTDNPAATVVQALGQHFVAAQVRHFPYANYEKALEWLKQGGPA